MTDTATLLAVYDEQLRTDAETPSALSVVVHGPLRLVTFPHGRGFVTYRDLGAADAAGIRELVGAALAHFAAQPDVTKVEWKTRGHDVAPGLHEALVDAGFEPEEPESIMLGEARLLAVDLPLPDGVTLRTVTDEADVRAMSAMADEAFGDPVSDERAESLLHRLALDDGMELWVAEADGRMVSAGRLEPVPHTEVAGIWGGATLAAWRGRGIYRALTAARARSALRLGKTIIHSDSTEFSRPILERSGFVKVSTTTPYTWRRPPGYRGPMDREGAQQWLDRYVAAWRSYDRDEIAGLFADDVAYRYHPYDDPVTGRDAVVADWLGEGEVSAAASSRDKPGTYDAHYAPVAVDGDTVVASGRSTYRKSPQGPVTAVFHNCFVIRFDGDGRCREFTEYFIKQPGPSQSGSETGGFNMSAEVRTLETPEVDLVYEVRAPGTTDAAHRTLVMAGHPMQAGGFEVLAQHFPDRVVVTYDPRGTGRSVRKDGSDQRTPQLHAADLHALIAELGGGPVDLFASSGGAVNALALVETHPGDVATLVAHEPPLLLLLPDADRAVAAERAVQAAYHERGYGAGMAAFIALTAWPGELTDAYLAQPAPDPAQFGMPADDDGRRDDPLLSGTANAITSFRPDPSALLASSTRVVVGVAAESGDTLTGRTTRALGQLLGLPVTEFPSHHAGFLAADSGYGGEPEAFAARLHEVLDDGAV